jgi:hypothetical protein
MVLLIGLPPLSCIALQMHYCSSDLQGCRDAISGGASRRNVVGRLYAYTELHRYIGLTMYIYHIYVGLSCTNYILICNSTHKSQMVQKKLECQLPFT